MSESGGVEGDGVYFRILPSVQVDFTEPVLGNKQRG